MAKGRSLRIGMWVAVSLAILFQAAFLIELHGSVATDWILWVSFITSIVCFVIFEHIRIRLTSFKHGNYRKQR